jgi:hypothetical protein
MAQDDKEKASTFNARHGPDTNPNRKAEWQGREGKTHIGAYLDLGYRRGLRLVQAQTDKDLQQLLAEALNDLFRKYNVTTVN